MNNYKVKSWNLAYKGLDEGARTVQFYGTVFDVLDSDGEVITKASVQKWYDEYKEGLGDAFRRLKHFREHDRTDCIGTIIDVQMDDYGILFTSKITSAMPDSQQVMARYRDGIYTEHSIGFTAVVDEERSTNGMEAGTFLKDVYIWEVSTLAGWGANKEARTQGIKSMENNLSVIKGLEQQVESLKSDNEHLNEQIESINKLYRINKILKNG